MSFKDYFKFGEVFGYYFRKKDPSRPNNVNIRMMHWSNKISIIGLPNSLNLFDMQQDKKN